MVNASNQLLEALGSSLNGLPMRRVELGPKQQLVDVGEEVKSVYFPINAIISIIAPLATGESLEVAMIGRDGGIGVGEALNGRTSHSQWIVQHPGTAITCHASAFRHIAWRCKAVFSNSA